ncbi:inovirus Gp2 family protein [Aeromonas veronii]|uniref:inovirus Gp2 family protein n=1 Tax=Aeromonas TaxID=642 RepID=UPI00214DB996|nr:inovirus Gp2 family protein [Aeromonas veronii]MCR3964173.1 inovirus Gp2 family protein [Aeromonas veronii]
MKSKVGYHLIADELENLRVVAEAKYGSISFEQLKTSVEVIANFLNKHPRVFAVRVDLRFPQIPVMDDPDMPTGFPPEVEEEEVITRFFASLKSQIQAARHRKGKAGKPFFLGFIWVKEQVTSQYPHYHVVLLFNRDDYGHLGDYSNFNADNMATRICKAWCRALRLTYPDYSSLVHFPDDAEYRFDHRDADLHNEKFYKFLERTAYLFKLRTKVRNSRNFGRSQLIR